MGQEINTNSEENPTNKTGFRFGRKEILVLIAGTALALGSFRSDDPLVVIPMLVLAAIAFILLCFWHEGSRSGRGIAAILLMILLTFIGWRDLRKIDKSSSGPALLRPQPVSEPPQSQPKSVPAPDKTKTAQKKRPPIPLRDVKQGGNGDCQANSIGGNATVENSCNNGPPPLKIKWSVSEKISQDSRHAFYREIAITPNVEWHPIAVVIKCSADIKEITPYGLLFSADGYVSPQDSKTGYVTAQGPAVAPEQSFIVGIFADEPITIESVELSNVPRRRNVTEGPL
jgi:hypothetical protein